MRTGLLRVGVIAAFAAMSLPGVAAATGYAASVSVAPSPISRPIPRGFIGLAFEYSSVPAWVGHTTGQPNPVLLQLIRNLTPAGRPVIRIGGLSTDHSWWPVASMRVPAGVTYTITPAWAQAMQSLARAADAQLVLGINLEADSRPVAQAEADQFVTRIGRRYLAALDLGNEPPLYQSVPWYRVHSGEVIPWYSNVGTAVFGRGLDWSPRVFAGDYARILAALPHVSIAGPDTQRPSWFAAYEHFVSPRSRVRVIASHGYGLNNCVTQPSAPAYPSISHMLSTYALSDLLSGLTPFVGFAHQNGATFRVDEMGSVTCNGRWGVSDTMASALWAAGALFTVAQDGVDGVNLHSYPRLSNALFDFSHSSSGWTGTVHPLYYGVLLFEHAAPAGSRLMQVALHGPSSVRAWATAGPGSARHVLLINDSLTDRASVVVAPPPGDVATKVAQLERLEASSASATNDIHLGARTFGEATTTGRLGRAVRDAVAARGGAFRVTLPAASAALLTFTGRGAARAP
ncbi:MAG: glycosyl hydrolase family 79 C-terminal domain-containing protein [Solirubrobacteraceae bacterium]